MAVKIGYLGPKGTFTKLAVDAAFNGEHKIDFKTIPQCIDAVNNQEIDIGVIPIENAIEGTVQLSIDYLVHQVRLPVYGEIVVPIQQNLLVHKNFKGTLADIKEVHSHRHAIAQCQQYLHKNLPDATIHYTDSTGSAAEMISENGNPIAAIGNFSAAKEYDLTILEAGIHDYPNNHTRFIVLAKDKEQIKINHAPSLERTTLLVELPPDDRAGALYQVLAAFAWRKMNLSKIESRPMKTGLGNYFFIIDVDEPYDDALFPGVRGELEALGCKVNVLGTYPVYKLDFNKMSNF